jgi:ribonuclease BN (tRNA processing enzyme)
VKLTILGASAAYQGLDNPCSGYLLQDGDKNILIDCGSGVLGNLQSHIDLRSVSDIIITHMHPDHFFDLIPYRYALRYGLNTPDNLPRVHLPPGGVETLNNVVAPFAESETFFSDVFQISEFNTGKPLQIGHFTVEFTAVWHYIPAYALSITALSKLAYSSDSGLCPELTQAAKGADLFLCTVGRCLGEEIASLWGHLSPEEAGSIAKDAGAKRLILTHLWPACDKASCLEKASNAFGAQAEMALVNHTYTIYQD